MLRERLDLVLQGLVASVCQDPQVVLDLALRVNKYLQLLLYRLRNDVRVREDGTHSVQDEQRAPRFHVHLRVLVEAEHHGLRESLVDALANAFLEL